MTTLSRHDLFFAAQTGIKRRISAMAKGRPEPYGTPEAELWGNDIESCCAELLVSKALNRHWVPFADDPQTIGSDVGEGIQVRWTWRTGGCLILHPQDRDEQSFVLVVGRSPAQRIAGWIQGRAGKDQRFWRTDTGRPAFFVPQSQLLTLNSLK